MKLARIVVAFHFLMAAGISVSALSSSSDHAPKVVVPLIRTEDEWKKILTPEQFSVCRQKGTERPFTGDYWNNHEKGTYRCVACGLDLFSSETKFESGTGWPSFWKPISEDYVRTEKDTSFGMDRAEILCARCDSHLGHVFEDGPKPTGLRYCINSAALKFVKEERQPKRTK